MNPNRIERLLAAANSSPDGDTSINIAKRTFLHDDDCASFFQATRSKLFDISEWNKNSSASEYKLFEESGREAPSTSITTGRFIRIRLYASGKYDWVRVTAIYDEPDEVVLMVKPAFDPTAEPVDRSTTSHFFGPEAENNFCVQREKKTVAFYIIGLNETQNIAYTDSIIESARNAAVANVGYYSGLQKAVWKQFCTKILETDEEKEG
jgi:hypothetical protein